MDIIFLAYANSIHSPLSTLREEELETYQSLVSRAKQGHFMVHRESQATLDRIYEYLTFI